MGKVKQSNQLTGNDSSNGRCQEELSLWGMKEVHYFLVTLKV